MNDDPFVISVTEFVARAKAKANMALRATAYDALQRVKKLTPVDTGYLRASWQVSIKGDMLPLNGGQDSITVISTLRMGDTVIISNPVRYAARIEYGFVGADKLGRRYNQAGVGMMTQTMAELPQIAQAATARVMG